jgi:hypothetical protein
VTPRCSHCATLLVQVELGWHCAGCESALLADSILHQALGDARPVRSQMITTGPGQRCPRCSAQMSAGVLRDSHVDRCPEHGVWLSADELERLAPELARTRRDIQDAWVAHLGEVLDDVHIAGHRLVAGSPPVAIDVDHDLRMRVAAPALAGTSLRMYFGDVRGGDAETGDATFDRAWRILTDQIALPRLLFPAAVRTLAQRTRTLSRGIEIGVELNVGQGDVTLVMSRDYDLERALAAISLVQAIARRPDAIDGELRAYAIALGGTPRSGAWTWRGGFTATVPCGRAVATLEVAAGESRLVVEGSAPVGWARFTRNVMVRGERTYARSPFAGYFADGDAPLDADLLTAARPDTVQLGIPFRPAPRCEVAWHGWLPPLEQLRAALRLAADALGDAASSAGPYR